MCGGGGVKRKGRVAWTGMTFGLWRRQESVPFPSFCACGLCGVGGERPRGGDRDGYAGAA